MKIFLLTFAIFAIALLAMAVGVMVSGRRLSGSCGGVSPDGDELGDCLCARKDKDICASDDETGLIGMAELGYPKRALKDHPPTEGLSV